MFSPLPGPSGGSRFSGTFMKLDLGEEPDEPSREEKEWVAAAMDEIKEAIESVADRYGLKLRRVGFLAMFVAGLVWQENCNHPDIGLSDPDGE